MSQFQTLAGLLTSQASRNPHRPFLRWSDRDKTLTFAEADLAAARAAAVLKDLGVQRGDRVGLLAHNGLDYLIAMFGAWRLGAISAHISVMTGHELAWYANACTPKVLVYTHDLFEAVDRDRAEMSSISTYICMDGPQLGALGWSDLIDSTSPLEEQNIDSEIPAHLSFTSGSTGRPKAAVLRHSPTVRASACIAERLQLRPDDRTLGVTSPASSYGLVANWLPGLHRGACVGLRKAWDASAVYDDMVADNVTFLASNPPQLQDLLALSRKRGGPPASLRLVVSGGEAVPSELKRAYFDELGVTFCESYGQSELGGFVALARPERPMPEHLGAVGEPLPDKEVRILDDVGREVAAGEPGEICIRGGYMWGYWNDEIQTAHALRDGWLHTGDLGSISPSGHVSTLGRYNERINTDEGLLLPRPVEEKISAAHKAVRYVAVVQGPGGPRAVVALWPDVPPITANGLFDAYRARPMADLRLHDVLIIDEMPMTSTGKLDRVALRLRYGKPSS
jgi:long-chain acyl-CoA synthetase